MINLVVFLKTNDIPITDWIQALAAFVAIPAAIISFIRLFKKSNELQSQIIELSRIAKQSEIQSRHLAAQVEQMTESNRIQTEYIMLFQKFVLFNEKSREFDEEKTRIDSLSRKNSIKPRLEFDSMLTSPMDGIKLNIINYGETAILKDIEKISGNTIDNITCQQIDNSIERNETISIQFKTNQSKSILDSCTNIKLHFEDKDGNKYYLIINGKGQDILKIGKTIEEK